MNKKILFVDDEQHILDSMSRNLRKLYDVSTALGAEQALALLNEKPDEFAVIVTDMRMPGMDGVEFLTEAMKINSETIRLMLTGNADQETAVKAVNTGEVFRFLNKPCDSEELRYVLDLALRQYELVTAEKELLENTLKGSIEALAEVLALVSPLAFGRVKRLRNRCNQLAKAISAQNLWEIDTAALMSQLGCVTLPESILQQVMEGETLSKPDHSQYLQQASMACRLVEKIPRMENVSTIIAYQHKHFNGKGYPEDDVSSTDIPLGARILHIALAFDDRVAAGWSEISALEELKQNANYYDPDLLSVLENCINTQEARVTIKVSLNRLREGMVLGEDLLTDGGMLLACKGLEVNEMMREHLKNFQNKGTLSPRNVLVVVSRDVASENDDCSNDEIMTDESLAS